MDANKLASSLLQESDWVNAISACPNALARRWVLFACANVVLPYWESRFDRDDSMSKLVDHMKHAALAPSVENDARLKAAIPNRQRKHWDLSLPPDFGEEHRSDCPADFAGDSIFHAAHAFFSEPNDSNDFLSAFETAQECLGRLFAERDKDFEGDTNHDEMAATYLQEKMLEVLRQTSPR